MSKPAAFRAEYADWKLIRTRKTVQIVLEVPVEQADLAYEVLGGMPNPAESVWCAVARLKGGDAAAERNTDHVDTSPASVPDKPPGRAKVPFDQMSSGQQAGILCADKSFHRFLEQHYEYEHIESATDAANVVRELCHVDSRADIVKDQWASTQWGKIIDNFRLWQRYPEYA